MKKMLSILGASVLAAASLSASVGSGGSQKAAAADQVRIMPVGDSITNGEGETGGYRKYLDYILNQKGISFDMVGPNRDMNASFSYNGQTVQYDSDHAGFSGFQIKQVPDWGKANNTGSLYNELKNKNAVKTYKPDIILLIIGTNDMTANRSMSDCSNDLHDLVDYMLADMPSGGMIFMGSIPEFTRYGGNPQRIANYNETVQSVAEDYSNAGKNVRFVDTHGCLNGMSDIGSDELHPNGKGYEKLGKFWAEVIEDYLDGSSSGSDNPGDPDEPDDPAEPPFSGDALLYTDFESGLSGWEGRSATVAVTKTDAAAGKQSASVTGRTDAWNGILYDISSLCPAGTVIDVSVKVKQSSGSPVTFKLTVQYGSGNNVEYDTFAEKSISSGSWTTISASKYTVESGSNPLLYIETDKDKCDFYVDEIVITKTQGVPQPAVYKLGDVDGNGTINAVDLTLAKNGVMHEFANNSQKKMADVDYSGTVDSADISWFVQYLTGQVTEFPEPVTPPKSEMRTISEYTPIAKAELQNLDYSILNSSAGTQYGEVKKEYYRSKAANKDKPYNILLPANYDPNKQYPVLYILHGYYENEDRMMITGNNNEAMKTKELVGNLISQGKAVDMIVVSPLVFTSATMNGSSGMDNQSNAAYDAFVDDIVDSLMPHIESKYSVATGRENTAVTGFSMGGRESLQIGMKHADKFGYVGAACPAPGVSGSFKWNSEEEAPSLVYITAGTADDVVGTSIPEGYHNNFDKNNVPNIWQVVQNGHHGDDSIRTHLYNFVQFVFKA